MAFYRKRKCFFYLPSLTNTGYSKCDVNTNNSVNASLKKTAITYWDQFFYLSLEYENEICLLTYSWVIRVLYELLLYSSRNFTIGFTKSEFHPAKPKIMDSKCCWPVISNCSLFLQVKEHNWLYFGSHSASTTKLLSTQTVEKSKLSFFPSSYGR